MSSAHCSCFTQPKSRMLHSPLRTRAELSLQEPVRPWWLKEMHIPACSTPPVGPIAGRLRVRPRGRRRRCRWGPGTGTVPTPRGHSKNVPRALARLFPPAA
ncbi:hypothetical protein DV515_00019114, partial [Chloebia gouldiae]